jgi:hypothetical protein
MPKLGRPRKNAAEPMSLTVSMRVTRAEYFWLQDQARKHGRSVGDELRLSALAGMPRPAAAATPTA